MPKSSPHSSCQNLCLALGCFCLEKRVPFLIPMKISSTCQAKCQWGSSCPEKVPCFNLYQITEQASSSSMEVSKVTSACLCLFCTHSFFPSVGPIRGKLSLDGYPRRKIKTILRQTKTEFATIILNVNRLNFPLKDKNCHNFCIIIHLSAVHRRYT